MIRGKLMDLRRYRRPRDGSSPQPGTLTVAVREAARFDRRAVSTSAGLLAAIPVVSMVALGSVAVSVALPIVLVIVAGTSAV